MLQLTSAQGDTNSALFIMNLAFMQLESHLLPSLQEIITSSVGSLKHLLSVTLDHFILKLMTSLKESNNVTWRREINSLSRTTAQTMDASASHQDDETMIKTMIHPIVKSLLSA